MGGKVSVIRRADRLNQRVTATTGHGFTISIGIALRMVYP